MEFQVNDVAYRSGKMNAMTQFHVSRRMAPLLSSLTDLVQGGQMDVPSVLASLMGEISKLSDADC